MQLAIWSKCRKPVITAFCLYYGLFTIVQALPKRWPVTIFLRQSTPELMVKLGLDYRLTLFSTQREKIPVYVYRIHYPTGRVMDWAYPEPEFMFDKLLYRRIYIQLMNFVRVSESSEVETARYLARRFDTTSDHPVLVECIEIVYTTSPLGKKPISPSAHTVFTYAVNSQDLAAHAGAAAVFQDHLDK